MKLLLRLAVCATLLPALPAAAQTLPDSLPTGVTALMLLDGRSVFRGDGICAVCHGSDAKGLTNLGNDLTDSVWVHGDGSYEAILKTLKEGAWAESGTAMPHQRATTLTDQQVRSVAAYVWSLSRQAVPGK